MERTAIYARSATGENSAIQKQINACNEYAEKFGCRVDGKHVYYAVRSGKSELHSSPELVSLLYAAQAGEIDKLLITDRSRISRNQISVASTIAYLAKCQVETIILDEQ